MAAKPIIAHSVSRIKTWEQCPWKYHENNISKNAKFTETPATKRGNEIHDSIENYLKGSKKLLAEVKHIQKRLDKLMMRPGTLIPEGSTTILQDETLTTWFDRNAWFRFKIDAVYISESGRSAMILDWKTGSSKYPDNFQLESYAVAISLRYPDIEVVKSQYVWLDEGGSTAPLVMERDEVARAKDRLFEKAFEVESGIKRGEFDCKENKFCNWCNVREQGLCPIKD